LIDSDSVPILSRSTLLSLIEWFKKHREKSEQHAATHDMGFPSTKPPVSTDWPAGSDGFEKIEGKEKQGDCQ
jgi:hypothetical protein